MPTFPPACRAAALRAAATLGAAAEPLAPLAKRFIKSTDEETRDAAKEVLRRVAARE